MAQTLVTLSNGERLAIGVYHAFLQIQAAVRVALGITLLVNSGFRTAEKQEEIFRSRYVIASQVNGRRVYDIRYWRGVAWYRISSAGTVAVPGTSLHEKASAVDFGGIPAGGGNALANWMRANAPGFGFSPTGYGFGEAWHYDYTGDPWAGSTTDTPIEEDDMPYTPKELQDIMQLAAHNAVVNILRSKEFGPNRIDAIAAAVHNRRVSDDTGTLAQTTRDTRRIARETQVTVGEIAALGVDLTE